MASGQGGDSIRRLLAAARKRGSGTAGPAIGSGQPNSAMGSARTRTPHAQGHRLPKNDWERDRIEEQWAYIGPRLRQRWNNLTDADVRARSGNADCLADLLQARYGMDRREALLQVYEFEAELPRL